MNAWRNNGSVFGTRRGAVAAGICALILGLTPSLRAHDIPTDVTIQAFIKPEGQRLRLLMRVPLGAIVDVDYPRFGPGYLNLARADDSLREAARGWIRDFGGVHEGSTRLGPPDIMAFRVSLPSDKSFATYEQALAHVISGERLPPATELYWNQGVLDVLYEYPIQSAQSDFSIEPGLERFGMRVNTVLRFLPVTGVVRAFNFHGDPGLTRLDPRWHQAAIRFVGLGFRHILDGIDHLLFLLCLVIPFRQFRPLIVIVTSFTVAHSITLIASAFDFAPSALWFPPLIETLIAASIVYMGLENIVGSFDGGRSAPVHRRWLIAFGFGLVHGFGFSFALRETLQFAGSHLLTSLVAFNVGVELGQLLVLLIAVPAFGLLFRFVVAERIGTILVSALVVHTAWHWLGQRADQLRQHRFEWPAFDLMLLVGLTRWLILVVLVACAAWLIFGVFGPQIVGSRKREDTLAG
ncbi:MAG TPA: HupE/UreJ family protein [Vicinamibacterales bacterium]